MRKREIKIIVPFRSVPSRYIRENSKKRAKKLKKLKNSKKNSVTFQSDAQQKILEKQQNNSKN